jgi:signal transduction histidine kinase/DNA-binding response OmpR family regulator
VSDIAKLEQQLQEAQSEIEKLKQTNLLLKKRALQAIIGSRSAAQCEVDRKECEVGRTQAEHSSRVKSLFLENVSHEIRSSMNGVVGMTELVLETELSPVQRTYLEMVEASVDRLMVVVGEILDFSRIETGELELSTENFALKESLDHDLYILNISAEKKDLGLSCSIDSSVPSHVLGDPARLAQIVTNLITNSIKYTERGGISVNIKNDGYDHNNNLMLRFSVVDSGRGVDPTSLDLIRNYFKKEGDPRESHPLSLGTGGLGLTVTSQLVKLMGGKIGVESGPKGSTFWFVLPFKEVADISEIEKKANATFENIEEEVSYALRGAKVLLAEDEYINRMLVETVLNQLGVDVTSVDNGLKAVEKVCDGDFQLVLMDIQMDHLDGLEAARRIRKYEKQHGGGHVPIIALTALALAGDRERCLQAGMDDYLAKPLERKDVIDVLSRYLTSSALVVDSDPESQNVFVRTLIESGWRVTIAETKQLAMYEASLSHFDMVVLDLDNPSLEGLEAVKIIRQLEEYSGRKASILGLGSDATAEGVSAAGFDLFLQRPVTREKILQKIEAVESLG